jgi:hypothetical protein
LEKFCRELKGRIHMRYFLAPGFSYVRTDVTIETGVDLAAIDELSQVFQRVDFAFLQVLGVNDAFPILV